MFLTSSFTVQDVVSNAVEMMKERDGRKFLSSLLWNAAVKQYELKNLSQAWKCMEACALATVDPPNSLSLIFPPAFPFGFGIGFGIAGRFYLPGDDRVTRSAAARVVAMCALEMGRYNDAKEFAGMLYAHH